MVSNKSTYHALIIGAGAAGLMCAIEAGKPKRRELVIDKASKAGPKILFSGGGRCNFACLYIEPEAYLSENSHFVRSALSRATIFCRPGLQAGVQDSLYSFRGTAEAS